MSQLLPYETIVKASEGDPEAVAASYPIMRDISALVRKWTDRLTRICRSISSGN